MYQGKITDLIDLGVMESFKYKFQVLMSASEAAEMILRVDDIIKCAQRQKNGDH
jgi:T-complex protein 1 subunit beta